LAKRDSKAKEEEKKKKKEYQFVGFYEVYFSHTYGKAAFGSESPSSLTFAYASSLAWSQCHASFDFEIRYR
jgi:hypothetical protein